MEVKLQLSHRLKTDDSWKQGQGDIIYAGLADMYTLQSFNTPNKAVLLITVSEKWTKPQKVFDNRAIEWGKGKLKPAR